MSQDNAATGGDRPPSGELQPSGLGPLGDLQLLATVLRSDGDDVESYTRVLTGALGNALPAGMVEVEHQRSLSDRMAGRPGRPVRLLVRGADRELELSQGSHGAVRAQVRSVVRGVVISRKDVGIDQWVSELAGELSTSAAQNAAARTALERLLGR